ncbi:hypothetical protein CMI47_15315 [Candidatus Pacearchaeota archaeon]|nr:hypothetical protein [Candidatus Pacearchaeota archaeon]|tara:strand:+ start:9476 stop:10762 length:1287 start_codon:yes stop_codon:yes gene_type:complete
MKPNIIFVLIDALRARNLSLFGYEKEFDKNIKRIADESIFFTNFITSANATYPSLTSLFTGKYPVNNGIVHNLPHTPSEELEKLKKNKFWLPLYLKKLGYDTYFISLTGAWIRKGFDFVQNEEKKDAYRKINDKKLVRKVLKLFPDWAYVLLKKIVKRDPKTDFPKPKETVDLAISKIKEAKKPYFMFVHFEDVHYPWATTDTPKVESKKSKKEVLREIETEVQRKYVSRRMFNTNTNSVEEVEGKYNKALESVDKEVGRFYDFLKETGTLNDCVFVLFSDHGFSIAEHGIYLNHTGLYDETLHVPLFMQIPGIKPKEINEIVQNVDIAPTIVDVLNDKRNDFDGKSFLNMLKTGKPIRKEAFSFDGSCGDRWSVRDKKKKIIFTKDKRCFSCKAGHGEEIEEYDLEKDPRELNNVYSGGYGMRKFEN